MSKGKNTRYGDKERELARALYAVSGNVSEVSERLGIPRTTVSSWLKDFSPDELENLMKFCADAVNFTLDLQRENATKTHNTAQEI